MIKIFNASQIRAIDQLTIKQEPIASIDLMERAATCAVREIEKVLSPDSRVIIFCGMGNNGGDGLAIARLLLAKHISVDIFVIKHKDESSPDFVMNKKRLNRTGKEIYEIEKVSDFPELSAKDIVIDALLGSGISRPIDGLVKEVVGAINTCDCFTISIDINTGLFTDKSVGNQESMIVRSNLTITFQFPKLSFLFPDSGAHIDEWKVVDIGLHPEAIEETETDFYLIEKADVRNIYRPKSKFSHKGINGHSLLIGGSHGKIGAVVLAARGALRAGVGLLTTYVPGCGYSILQTTIPEAMVLCDQCETNISAVPPLDVYASVGIGIGMGENTDTVKSLKMLLNAEIIPPLVLDADALNIIASEKLEIPKGSIITPHLREFERLAGKTQTGFERIQLQQKWSKEKGIYIVLKGAYSSISIPNGSVFFCPIACPALATGGSGDVLTGVLTALLAQGYNHQEACLLGVYSHASAGVEADKEKGTEGVIASDIISYLRIGR